MQKTADEICYLKRQYEQLKCDIAEEEKHNDELFAKGNVLKTDYTDYALNFGIIRDYPADKLYSEMFISGVKSRGKKTALVREMIKINADLENERDRMKRINQSFSAFLINSGRLTLL